MANSSLRNSIHRRNHKERSQPAHRAKLGLLEKHKDYVKRARDYKSKRDRLKKLKEKIAFRNKDEFYWGMVRGKTEGGVHIQSRGNEPLPPSVVQLLKTQDSNYLRTILAQEQSKIQAVKEQLHALVDLLPDVEDVDSEDEDGELDVKLLREAGILPPAEEEERGKRGKGKGKAEIKGKKHMIFAESREELRNYTLPTASSSTPTSPPRSTTPPPPEDLGWLPLKSKKSTPKPSPLAEEASTQAALDLELQESALLTEAKEHRSLLLRELSGRLKRLEQLKGVYAHMEQQRMMMGAKGGLRVVRRAEKVVEGESEDEGERRVSWRPKVVKRKAERRK